MRKRKTREFVPGYDGVKFIIHNGPDDITVLCVGYSILFILKQLGFLSLAVGVIAFAWWLSQLA